MIRTSSENIINRWFLITLLVGGAITSAVTYNVYHSNEVRINQAAAEASSILRQEVQSRIELYQYGLRGARGTILTAGENDISRALFLQYSATRDVDIEFPGARGFGFIRRVPQSEKERFLVKARQDGWPDFSIKMLNPNFAEHYVIEYIEPVGRNRQAVGLDIASEKNRREAAASSLYSGEVRLTGPITLVQATGKPQQSFLILMPIYRGGKTPATLQDRLSLGFGWSYAPLLMEEVLSGLKFDSNKVQYRLYDTTDLDDQVLFYNSGELKGAGYQQTQTSVVYGRHWRSELSVSLAFIADLHLPNPGLIGVFGIAISVLAALVVAIGRVNIARRRELMSYQARITALVESSADGIISMGLDGLIVSWNKGAEHIFGFTQEEAIGNTSFDFLVPRALRDEEASIVAEVKRQKQAQSVETRRKTKMGAEVPVALTMSPILDANNQIIGVSKSVRDISERIKAEAQIRELNTNLEHQVKERTAELQQLNLLLNDVLNASSEVSIIATDTNGVITLFNSGAERMLGYIAEEVVGLSTPLIFHVGAEIEKHRKEIQEQYGVFVEEDLAVLSYKVLKREVVSQEWTYVDKRGNTRPVSLVITPMKNSEGGVVGFLGIAMDISEQKRSERELIYTRDQLLLAAEVAELGIWTWNIEKDILEWNDLMFSMYHVPLSVKERGVTYRDWYNCVHPDDRAKAESAMKEAIEGVKEYNVVFRIILPDQRIRYISARASLQKSPLGKMTVMTGINRDITNEHELEDWLRKAKDEADAASAAKSNFLANMSHEIRTPMNAILGMLHLAKRTQLTPQQEDYVTKAQISATSLLRLINDVLDFSKVDAGKLELEKAPFEMEGLLCELSTLLSAGALEKNVELIFDIDESIPNVLIGDKLRLLQVLINLLSNAIKFTLEGSVVLCIDQVGMSQNVSRLSFSVTDTGIGIAEDQIDSIFDVFSQAESSTARRFGGSGLGLVICRRFVELMGGSLDVKSVKGEGSEFYFTIDFPVADQGERVASQPHEAQALRVLIVDHQPKTQAILARMSSTLGWFTESVSSLQSAISALVNGVSESRAFDVILLDVHTPDFNGQKSIDAFYSAVARVDYEPKIIIVSRMMNNQTTGEYHAVAGYLLKPLTLQRLSEVVQQAVLGTTSSIHEVNDMGAKRLAGLALLLVEDNAFNRQVATELLAVEGAEVTVAEGGIEGVAMVLNHPVNTFDLVLMDMQMPDVDGLEATRQIRQDERFADLPIIAMTANVSQADRDACLNAGMNDHIGKPLDIDQMVERICHYTLKQTNSERSEHTLIAQEVPEEASVQAPDVDNDYEPISSILSRFGGSAELYLSVLEGFKSEAKVLLGNIQDGLNEQNVEKTREHLHTLKGASLTMGALKFSNQLFSYESVLKTSEDINEIQACLLFIDPNVLENELDLELARIIEQLG